MEPHGRLMAEVSDAIGTVTGARFQFAAGEMAAGGCISRSLTVTGTDGRRFFLKLNDGSRAGMFASEAAGLSELGRANALRVPTPIAWGVTEATAWLVLEYLALESAGDPVALGKGLAQLHRTCSPMPIAAFGWHQDNTIGATPQVNTPAREWQGFFRDCRLGFQLNLAKQQGAGKRLLRDGERLMADMDQFFGGYAPQPSLLHGDLWSGNHAYCDGGPVVFDPAVYYGDREADLAMTELFGGFSPRFYQAYQEAWPLDPGYPTRRDLYNLYHVLNHFNMFGGGYGNQAERMASSLLAQLG